MPYCSVCSYRFPCHGSLFPTISALEMEISTSYPFLHPDLGPDAFGSATSLRSHRDHLLKQKSEELQRLEKTLATITNEDRRFEGISTKIAALKQELGVKVVENE